MLARPPPMTFYKTSQGSGTLMDRLTNIFNMQYCNQVLSIACLSRTQFYLLVIHQVAKKRLYMVRQIMKSTR